MMKRDKMKMNNITTLMTFAMHYTNPILPRKKNMVQTEHLERKTLDKLIVDTSKDQDSQVMTSNFNDSSDQLQCFCSFKTLSYENVEA